MPLLSPCTNFAGNSYLLGLLVKPDFVKKIVSFLGKVPIPMLFIKKMMTLTFFYLTLDRNITVKE